jgi:thiol-disulfide isomerase/thioredoxin
MKNLLFTLSLIIVIACKQSSESETSTSFNKQESQEETSPEGMNTKVPDEEDGGEMLLGKINFKGLQQEPFKEWFELNEAEHVLDSILVDSIRPLLKNISIKVFMGTWCEDSQRELPALYKVLKATNYKMSDLDMIAVSHDKDTPEGFEKDYELQYVPSIIFFKDGAEINRIVEYTQETLEKDILKILSGKPYQHAYAE